MIYADKVSILICGHKIDSYIETALGSVASQTGVDFQVVFVANGPNFKAVASFVEANWKGVQPIKVVCTEIPQLAFALNLGLSFCDTKYVIRMDTDDVCLPGRFAKLFSYINDNKLDIVGSDVELINSNGNTLGIKKYSSRTRINRKIWFSNPFCHPSVIFKKSSILAVRGYNSGLASEDYDLWFRALRHGLRCDNTPETLLKYRLHNNATQGSIVAYAEVVALSIREFLLKPTIIGLVGCGGNLFKFFLRRVLNFIWF